MKFTPDGGRITVRGAHRRRATSIIAIEDTGIGIPKEALKKLGQPFEQVESQFTKTHRGSGLGLAIAKSLAELHGGAMRIRSTLGAGTIVLVRLPVRRPHVDGDEIAARGIEQGELRRLPQDPHEARAHLRLRLGEMRFERGEVGHVGGAREQARAAPARPVFGSNGPDRHSRRICVRL